LVGENGSGKSTLMQIIVGLLKRDAGEVERPERLGYCPQLPMVWEKLTVDEHFELYERAYGLEDAAREQAVIGLLEELVVAVAAIVTALNFTAASWLPMIAGLALIGMIFGAIGALAGAVLDSSPPPI
jgi:ABC-2 type transport system ATP-binding protein